ncbi:hypothetical protein AYI94_05455 [Shewanella algae]|nr:hypothetical protein AYI94_05455 [Shewanella algae]
MCALRRLTGLDARRGSQQMALVLCKKHNTAGRLVSHALRGFHSNRLSALSDFDMPRHAFSQMPRTPIAVQATLYKREGHEDLFAPSLIR